MPTKYVDDTTSYEAPTYYNNKPLTGSWAVYYKIDGVRALRKPDGSVVSRKNKPLCNLGHLAFNDAEIFRKNWNTSVSLVRTQAPRQITDKDVYELGKADPRLMFPTTNCVGETVPLVVMCPEPELLNNLMLIAVTRGYEGIVIRKVDSKTIKWIKLVPTRYEDIVVTGFTMSNKRHGWIKNFITDKGNISATSFTEEELTKIQHNTPESYIGETMEVGFREKTVTGKLRFAKFHRWRFDK